MRAYAAVLAATLIAAACGDAPLPADPLPAEAFVATLEAAGGAGQTMPGGRRSPAPFRVRARDAGGEPVAGARVTFTVVGPGGGDPSQPRALTDSEGYAESWLLRTRSGAGLLVAEAGSAKVEMPFVVTRAPGEVRFLPGSGAVGLPGHPHPDSLLEVRVLDTEGRPLAGQEVWFAASGALSRSMDTTGFDGVARAFLRRTDLAAGGGDVWAFILEFPELLAHDVRPVRPVAGRVVLVSVDGLRADALERWNAPVLRRLAAEGGYDPRARTVTPSLTAPGQLSLLSGVAPAAHGIFSDNLDFTPEMALLEPLFKQADRRGRTAVAFASREGPLGGFELALACRLAFGLDSLRLTAPSAAAAVDAALPALADSAVDLVFLHLPDPDLAGHREGFGSAAYGEAVAAVDAALGRVLAAIADPARETLLVVTSDHGGGGAWGAHQHGSSSPQDVEVPLILWGARATPTALTGRSILDVAPTVLWALGIAPPSSYEGRVLLEAFR